MLNRLQVRNFKSFRAAEFYPVGLNLVVGNNNAGKTNLCQALRFVGLSSCMPLDEAARVCTPEPWNLLNVYSNSDTAEFRVEAQILADTEPLAFSYTLSLSGRRHAISGVPATRPFRVEYESLRVTGGAFNDTTILENKAGSVRLLHEKRFVQSFGQLVTPSSAPLLDADFAYVETNAPTDTTMLFRLFDLETNRRANLFKRYLNSWTYYSFDPMRLRLSSATPMERTLNPDGSNLSSVLYTLHNERPRDERKLVEAMRLVEPRLDLISFQSPDPEHVYMFFEDKDGHRFGVQSISDGTLRFMAISYLIIANRGSHEPTTPVIMLEEPENGIFVGHLKPLFQRILPSGEEGQFIFTSHNPYFIDLFDAVPNGLHVVQSTTKGSEVVQPDVNRIQKYLDTFSLGEMHFRGLLQ